MSSNEVSQNVYIKVNAWERVQTHISCLSAEVIWFYLLTESQKQPGHKVDA